MSAIGGIIDWSNGVDPAALSSMIAAAPGFTGSNGAAWQDGQAGLIRVALATTPEAVAEVQPWRDAGSGMVICFDGRVDNREEVQAWIGRTALPVDAPDCAIVLAAWQRFGEQLLDRLAGDYAFAIWDAAERRLTCVRSPVGWRPLLWAATRDGIAFATEPAMLIDGAGLTPTIDEGAIAEYLAARFGCATDTLWRGIQRLAPGHLLTVDVHGIRTCRWLEGPFEDWSRRSDDDHVARFTELFDQALIASSRSTGPVAAHLSGGLDSSSIVCRSQMLARAGAIVRAPISLSVRFPGEECDEGPWIAAVEERCAIRSQMITPPPYDWAAAADWSARTRHLPLRPNTAGTIMSSCDWLQANGLSVLLTGEGGDDWLAGSFAHFPDQVRAGRILTWLREGMAAGSGVTARYRLRWTLSSGLGPLVSARRRARLLQPVDDTQGIPDWVAPDWARQTNLAERWRNISPPPGLATLAQRHRYGVYALAQRHVNIDNILSFAAGRGVEFRHPFHDFRLTRFVMGAAGGMLRRHGTTKYLLREAMRGTLPEEVRQRRDKARIVQPIYDAVTARLRERPIHRLSPVKFGWLDGGRLVAIEAEHAAWRAQGAHGKPPRSSYAAVWNAVAIDLWLEQAARIS
jgi:asparagine synthase (glutamine-hydrolysing)